MCVIVQGQLPRWKVIAALHLEYKRKYSGICQCLALDLGLLISKNQFSAILLLQVLGSNHVPNVFVDGMEVLPLDFES